MIVGGGHNRRVSKAVATGEGRETAAVLGQTHGCMDRSVSPSYSNRRMQRDNAVYMARDQVRHMSGDRQSHTP